MNEGGETLFYVQPNSNYIRHINKMKLESIDCCFVIHALVVFIYFNVVQSRVMWNGRSGTQ